MSLITTTPFGDAADMIYPATETLDLTPRQLAFYIEARSEALTFPVHAQFNLTPRKYGNDPNLILASGPMGLAPPSYSRPRRINSYRELRAWFDGADWGSHGENWRNYIEITPAMDAHGWDCETSAIGILATFGTLAAAEAFAAGVEAVGFAVGDDSIETRSAILKYAKGGVARRWVSFRE